MKRVRNLNDLSKMTGKGGRVKAPDGERIHFVYETAPAAPAAPAAEPTMPAALTELIAKLVQASEVRTTAMLAEQARMIDKLAQPTPPKVVPSQPDTKQPHQWVFTIQRDEIGRLQQITATPVPP